MKIHMIRVFLFSYLLGVSGCFSEKETARFNLRMDGIIVGYFEKVDEVYLFGENELYIPITERDGENLVDFVGNERSIDLSLFLGDKKIGDFTLFSAPSYNGLRLKYNPDIESILAEGGVRLERRAG